MNISPTNSIGPLRLVQPIAPAKSAQPVQPANPARPVERQTDAINFEQVYRANLPKPTLTDAHQRLERMRDLVAARVAAPMHFEEAVTVKPGSANPYAPAYPRITATPAELNTRATETAK